MISSLLVVGLVSPACSDPQQERSKVFGIGEATSVRSKEGGASEDDISKAYMNCLMDVDVMVGELAADKKQRASLAETETQLAFCENRKRECKMSPGSADCKVFIEEFVMDHAGNNKGPAKKEEGRK
jgi:hypothetical protein